MKKILVMLLTVSLLFGLSSTTNYAASKKSTKLSTSKTTITIAANKKTEKKVIKLKKYNKISRSKVKKVKWATSNKKVAGIKVSGKYRQKCTIIAKKAGKVTIKVKFNGKSYKCKVTIIKASNNNSNNTTETKNTQSTTETKKPHTTTETKKPHTTTENSTSTPNTNIPSTTTESTKPNKDTDTTHICPSLINCNYEIKTYNTPKVITEGTNIGKAILQHVVYTCPTCNKIVKDIDDTPAFYYGYKTTNPTCTTPGKKIKYNLYYNSDIAISTTDIPALGHNFIIDSDIKPKCPHQKGYITKHCTRCNTPPITQEYGGINGTYGYYWVNGVKYSDQYFDNFHYEITLHPNNYDHDYQISHGTYGTCTQESVCNVCQYHDYISTSYDCQALFRDIPTWKSRRVYLNVTNSTLSTNSSDYQKILEMVDGTVTVSNGVYTIHEK